MRRPEHPTLTPTVAAVASTLALALATLPAVAAVRHCAERIEAQADDARSEQAARKLALERWTATARAIGPQFTGWQIADNRSIQCARIAGGFRCRAGGTPCTISQVPGRVPKELQPGQPAAPFPSAPRKKGLDI